LTKEYPEKWLSGFQGKDNMSWQVGDVVEVERVEENGQYLNFYMPKGGTTPTDLSEVHKKLDRILYLLEDRATGADLPDYKPESPSEIPF